MRYIKSRTVKGSSVVTQVGGVRASDPSPHSPTRFGCSAPRRGDCFDNAVAESFFPALKGEEGERVESYAHAKEALVDHTAPEQTLNEPVKGLLDLPHPGLIGVRGTSRSTCNVAGTRNSRTPPDTGPASPGCRQS